MPTIFQWCFWIGIVAPRSRPCMRSAMRRPTMISSIPGWKFRPCLISIPPRTSNALGVTPRMVTLVCRPSVRRGIAPTTTISGEAIGRPSEATATRGSTTILLR